MLQHMYPMLLFDTELHARPFRVLVVTARKLVGLRFDCAPPPPCR